MKPRSLSNKVGRGLWTRRRPSLKSLIQVSALVIAALAMSGCVTVGYDLMNKQVTVTVKPETKGYAK